MAKQAKAKSAGVTVSKELLDAYRTDLGKVEVASQKYVEEIYRDLRRQYPNARISNLRDLAIASINDALNAFCDQSAVLASQYFETIAEAAGENPQFLIEDAIDRKFVDKNVRTYAEVLKSGDEEKFVEKITSLTGYCIRRNAHENLIRNCKRNDLRYARVPSGIETCAFCFMLSSRGFVYHSEKTAGGGSGHYHPNCSCVIVPGFEDKNKKLGVQVRGYDPDAMYSRYKSCVETIGGEQRLRKEFDNLPRAEKMKYYTRLNISNSNANASISSADSARAQKLYIRDKTLKEIATRDFSWLNQGKIPENDISIVNGKRFAYFDEKKIVKNNEKRYTPRYYQERYLAGGAGETQKEWQNEYVVDMLNFHGIRTQSRPLAQDRKETRHLQGVSSPDINIDGILWEIKNINNSNSGGKKSIENSILNQFQEAHNRNFKNPLDVENNCGMGDMRKETRVIINTLYKSDWSASHDEIDAAIRKYVGTGSGKFAVEAIWIDENGNIHRYK